VYSFVEEQSMYQTFRFRQQIDSMSQLVLTLGFVFIFGPVSPRIIPLCLLVFSVQLRALAIQLTSATNRTLPRIQPGIGAWSSILSGLMFLGLIFSGYLLVQFGPIFKGTETLTKATFWVLYGLSLEFLGRLVDFASPSRLLDTEILIASRNYVKSVLTAKGLEAHYTGFGGVDLKAQHGKPSQLRRQSLPDSASDADLTRADLLLTEATLLSAPYLKMVQDGDWAEIPKSVKKQLEVKMDEEDDGPEVMTRMEVMTKEVLG